VIPRARRLACAFVALATAAVLLHAPLADALVTRGDDAARNGDAGAAIRAYERAIRLDAGSAVAADRLAFTLAMRHDHAGAERAIAIATTALGIRPGDAALAADRGLAEMQLRRWSAAEADFALAGRGANDARYDHLAARMALRRGDRGAARRYARRALAADPAFRPAAALLRSIE
jgi:tetratricopeptide (TPR) repeat protein